MRELTLGSLFDGAGGFPFAAQHYGIKPIWASEIEKFPIEVTTKNFPEMKHLGDVSKINGADIDPVDIITFGSPCQDLSVAAKNRQGLAGDRSGLFHQAIRIIKEMRKATNDLYPRIAIWENVEGARSSNKGEDFRCVLEEFCKISQDDAYVPKPKKWGGAGNIVGNGYSVAWRILDAQFWGVPQRRRRIFLVADFGSECAGEILFKRAGLSRDFAEIRESWQGATKTFAFSSSSSVKCDSGRDCGENVTAVTYRKQAHPTNKEDGQGYEETSTADTLNTTDNSESRTPILIVCNGDCDGKDCVISVENRNHDSGVKVIDNGKTQTLSAMMGNGGNNEPYVLLCVRERCGKEGGGKGCLVYDDNHCGSLACNNNQFILLSRLDVYNQALQKQYRTLKAQTTAECLPCVMETVIVSAADCHSNLLNGDCFRTVLAQRSDHINQPCVIYALDYAAFNQGKNAQYNIMVDEKGKTATVRAKNSGGGSSMLHPERRRGK